jgi:G3E family GTPase
MPPTRTALHLITGATGSGKTGVIRTLLERRPPAERWAVLTNDFGHVTLGAGEPSLVENVSLRDIAGCACCSSSLVMRTALVSLLRDSASDRVLIEASSAAEPTDLLRLFAEPGLAPAVDVRPLIATAAVSQLLNARYVNAPVYRRQLETADVVIMTAPPSVRHEELAAARRALAELVSADARILDNAHELELRMLDEY